MPMLPAVTVANTFVDRHGRDGSIDHIKLQKLTYFAYGWWLALRPQSPPLVESRPQVWKLGPVFQPIYSAFSKYRDRPIDAMQPISPFQPPVPADQNTHPDDVAVLDWIWGKYGHFNGFTLSDMTHQQDTPWYHIAAKNNFVIAPFTEMDDGSIRTYFTRMARQEGYIQ